MAKRIRKTSYVRCRGGSPLLDGITRESLPKDCSAILELYPDGISKCRYGCLGGGTCVTACHLAAIKLEALRLLIVINASDADSVFVSARRIL